MTKKPKIIKINPEALHLSSEISKLREAAEIIKRNGIVAFPTETVYGLGANALSEEAVEKIFVAKKRARDDPLIVHIADKEDVYKLAKNISKRAEKLINAFFPGPLTLILEKKEIIPSITTANLSTVAIRMPSHKVAREFIKMCELPIAAPSANLFGKPSATKAEHVLADLGNKIDAIIDAGEANFGIESTVIDLTSEKPVMLRPGALEKEKIEKVLGEKVQVFRAGNLRKRAEEKIIAKSPGMKHRHYAPEAELILFKSDDKNKIAEEIAEKAEMEIKEGKKVGIIASYENAEKYKKAEKLGVIVKIIGSRKDYKSIARNLFQVMRELDYAGVELIFSESFEEKGLGLAIENRLERAATKIIKI